MRNNDWTAFCGENSCTLQSLPLSILTLIALRNKFPHKTVSIGLRNLFNIQRGDCQFIGSVYMRQMECAGIDIAVAFKVLRRQKKTDIIEKHLCYILIMPANLPPEYFEAEKRFKEAAAPQDKAVALEELIATVPKHKGTDKLRAELRRRLSQLREEAAKRKKSGKGDLYTVEKQGAGQIALAGFANSGKSSILKSLTNADPVVADYPVSTVVPLSGMMPFEDIQFQLVDLPPIGNESTDGWVSGSLRVADALLLVVDLAEDPDIQAELLIGQLEKWRIGLLKKSESPEECPGCKPAVVAASKSDLPAAQEGLRRLRSKYETLYPLVPVSCVAKEGLEELRWTLFENSRTVRIYSKEPGKEPDRAKPFVLPLGSTVLDLAEMIHRDFLNNFKYACIWGSAKFGGQRVQKDYVLRDRDVVEYHLK